LKAALKGLYYAFDNEAEAVDIVMKYAPREDKDHMAYMLRTEKERALHDMLAEFKGISKPIDVNLAFTDEFLKRIYDGQGRLRWP